MERGAKDLWRESCAGVLLPDIAECRVPTGSGGRSAGCRAGYGFCAGAGCAGTPA